MQFYVYFITKHGVVTESTAAYKVPPLTLTGPMGITFKLVGCQIQGFEGSIESVTYLEV